MSAIPNIIHPQFTETSERHEFISQSRVRQSSAREPVRENAVCGCADSSTAHPSALQRIRQNLRFSRWCWILWILLDSNDIHNDNNDNDITFVVAFFSRIDVDHRGLRNVTTHMLFLISMCSDTSICKLRRMFESLSLSWFLIVSGTIAPRFSWAWISRVCQTLKWASQGEYFCDKETEISSQRFKPVSFRASPAQCKPSLKLYIFFCWLGHVRDVGDINEY